MTREQLDELKADSRYKAEILSAFAEGKQIEWQETDTQFPDTWIEFNPAEDNEPFDWHNRVYRIKERWRAAEDNYYYYVDSGMQVDCIRDERTSFDDDRYEAGNYFHTEDEAIIARDELRVVLLKPRQA